MSKLNWKKYDGGHYVFLINPEFEIIIKKQDRIKKLNKLKRKS